MGATSGADSRARRVRILALTLPVVGAALTFVAWSQTWIEVDLTDDRFVVVSGATSAPALPPLALAALALVGALALAGPVFRGVLGALQALLGAGIIASALLVTSDPLSAAAPRITEVTGVAGTATLPSLVAASELTAWPWVTVLIGGAIIVIGIGIAITASQWPARSRRYDTLRAVSAADGARLDRLDAWDALSDGEDPTAR